VADAVLELCGKPASLKHFVNDRPGHDYRYALDATRIRSAGWQAAIGFRGGLQRTVDWYRNNEAWWRRRKGKEFWKFYQRNYQGLPSRAIPQ
jgi:dTDP-glucose 4,6-dehydratase